MRLASPDKLLSLLSVNPSAGGTQAAQDALDTTFALVEEATESRLVASTFTDTFALMGTRSHPSLRLSSGFLSSAKVTVTVGETLLDPSGYLVDQTLGQIHLLGVFTTATRIPVTVRFSCGFPAGSDNATLEDVPDSLSSAHLYLAASSMQLSPASVSKEKAKAMGATASRGFEIKARQILQGLARPRALVVWPTFTR